MSLQPHHGGWVIVMSFIISFILAVVPLPEWIVLWRPDWVALVLIYWCLALPERVGVASGWSLGIIHDVLLDTLLGQRALSLCILAYLSTKFHRQIRAFPIWQQAIIIFGFVALGQLPSVWIQGILGHPQTGWTFIFPAITSLLLWPWVFIILRDMRRTYQVF